jgi:Tol biopolymer transport system component
MGRPVSSRLPEGRVFRLCIAGAVASLAYTGAIAGAAQAAFPGANGRIAFASDRAGNQDVYTMNSDGTAVTRLTGDPADDGLPAWSADGTKIAFTSNRDGRQEVYVMNADGTAQTRVTNIGMATEGPAWSPDGRKLTFAAGGDIYTVNVNGTNPTVLPLGRKDDERDRTPAWSPDGTKIAFERLRSATSELHVANADGTAETAIPNGEYGGFPDWSHDGAKLAFNTFRGGDRSLEIYTMNPDGTGLARVTNSPDRSELAPAWSPDGKQITYTRLELDFVNNFEIHVVNSDGMRQTNLTSNPANDNFSDWQPIPGPRRTDYRNAAQFCKAERAFSGDAAFTAKYGTNGNGANAFGKCVSQNA